MEHVDVELKVGVAAAVVRSAAVAPDVVLQATTPRLVESADPGAVLILAAISEAS